jgi:hypothetical protein
MPRPASAARGLGPHRVPSLNENRYPDGRQSRSADQSRAIRHGGEEGRTRHDRARVRAMRRRQGHRSQSIVNKPRAGVWERQGELFVETHVHSPPTSDVLSQPRFFTKLSVGSSSDEIGNAVLAALDANYVDPELSDPTAILDTVYAAGLESYGSFTRGAKYVPVSLRENRIRAGPSDGTKHAGSFLGTGEDVLSASLAQADVGRAVIEALKRSIGRRSR